MTKLALALVLCLYAAAANAQSAGNSYLIEPNLAAAQARDASECQKRGCDGKDTSYWWGIIRNSTTGQAALEIQPSGPYGAVGPTPFTGLTATEKTALVPYASLPASWIPAQTGPAAVTGKP